MHRKMTITIDEAVYAGLHKVIGRGNISQFLEGLARPHVLKEGEATHLDNPGVIFLDGSDKKTIAILFEQPAMDDQHLVSWLQNHESVPLLSSPR